MTLNTRQHAALSACLTLVVASLFCLLLVWPALSKRAAFHERVDTLRIQQQKFIETAARAPALEAELAELAEHEIDREGFLEDKSHALAAADLQRLLGSLVEETGGSLVSTQVLADTGNEDVFPEITVKVHLLGNTAILQRLLYRFVSGEPVLVMDNLLVQQRRHNDDRRGQDASQLEIRFDASAFIYQSDPS